MFGGWQGDILGVGVSLDAFKDTREFIKQRQGAKDRRAQNQVSCRAIVKEWFPQAEIFAKGVTTKRAAKAEAKVVEADKKRWHADLEADAFKTLFACLPSQGLVRRDDFNGRFNLSYPHRKPRSISWTLRGSKVCVQEVLAQMWQWHTEHTGMAAPKHLKEILGV